jgi:protein-S-isoprenylcysteine O-methyltransferase Ste14
MWAMQPHFAHDPLALGVWVTGLLLWRVLEAGVDIRSFKRLRAGIRRQDRGSRVVLLFLIMSGTLLGVLVALKVPTAVIADASDFLSWLGVVLLYAGIALRLYAMAMLGAFFTTTVAVAPGQTVIERGPYRRIRHPSYTGLLLILLGFSLGLANWLSLLVIMGSALTGLAHRIRVEEEALQEQLGQRYREYMRSTKRLIPFVL